jgi:hypothetical protein
MDEPGRLRSDKLRKRQAEGTESPDMDRPPPGDPVAHAEGTGRTAEDGEHGESLPEVD